jgi:hypothetical protein
MREVRLINRVELSKVLHIIQEDRDLCHTTDITSGRQKDCLDALAACMRFICDTSFERLAG